MSFPLTLPSLKDPVLPQLLRRLPEAKVHGLFVFNALLEKGPKLSGPSLHAHFAALVQSDLKDEKDLQDWLRQRFARFQELPGKAFSNAQKQAGHWLEEERWAASWMETPPPGEGPLVCPSVLFGKGTLEAEQKWVAVFNSRKPKLVSPSAMWLQLLGPLPALVASQGLGFAGSLGTISYDLVAVGAERSGARLLLLLPHVLEALGEAKEAPPLALASPPDVALSCLTRAADCPKATRMVCRDRLLAFISDVHCILEVRPGGNLGRILERQQRQEPRFQLRMGREESGSGRLDHRFRRKGSFPTSKRLRTTDPGSIKGVFPKSQALRCPPALLEADALPWGAYLYHYTRACPGPWPGQSYRSYLESLLEAEPLAEHTALATLGRILMEGRVRAGSRIVRGNQGVSSWTSRPPQELGTIRRWNAALIRWTFEPYGLAVKRSVLRRMGARPAIYGGTAVYDKLPQKERFRFQLHDPPRCAWKNEREWRLPADLRLSDLEPEDAFLFMPTLAYAEELEEKTAVVLPIVVV